MARLRATEVGRHSCAASPPATEEGSQPSGAISNLANSNAGATTHPTNVHAPFGRAACHQPRGTTACGCCPAARSLPRMMDVLDCAVGPAISSCNGSPSWNSQCSSASTRCQRLCSPAASKNRMHVLAPRGASGARKVSRKKPPSGWRTNPRAEIISSAVRRGDGAFIERGSRLSMRVSVSESQWCLIHR